MVGFAVSTARAYVESDAASTMLHLVRWRDDAPADPVQVYTAPEPIQRIELLAP